jgi:hypothetical protein
MPPPSDMPAARNAPATEPGPGHPQTQSQCCCQCQCQCQQATAIKQAGPTSKCFLDETTADQPQWPPQAPGHYTTYERYVRVCQEILITVIFLGDRSPLLLSPRTPGPDLVQALARWLWASVQIGCPTSKCFLNFLDETMKPRLISSSGLHRRRATIRPRRDMFVCARRS